MRIGFDGKRAVCNNTGLGNYSRLVIEQLAATSAPTDHLWVYSPTLRDNPRLRTILNSRNITFVTPRSPLAVGTVWRSAGIIRDLRRDGIDIFHGLSNELPLNIRHSGIPSVVTIHDVIYRRLPWCYKPIDRKLYDLKYGHSCRAADRIIAISECTKRDIMHYYGVEEDKITVVYQGCDAQFDHQWSDEEKKDLRHRLHLPQRYIVQVGTIERRKNLALTIRALAALPSDIHLVAVGRDNGYKAECQRIADTEGVSGRIVWLHNTGFTDLPGVYQCAEAICYPSRYEGFGLPIIEGIRSRRPVIGATGSCLEEAGGDGAVYVNPDDVRSMAEALLTFTSPGYNHTDRLNAGLIHTAQFDTSRMADNIRAVYSTLVH